MTFASETAAELTRRARTKASRGGPSFRFPSIGGQVVSASTVRVHLIGLTALVLVLTVPVSVSIRKSPGQTRSARSCFGLLTGPPPITRLKTSPSRQTMVKTRSSYCQELWIEGDQAAAFFPRF